LPVTRKSDLKDLQALDAPFGGMTTTPPRELRRLFVSPGPSSILRVTGRTGGALHGQ